MRTRGKGGRWIVVFQIAGIPGPLTRQGDRFSSLSKARRHACKMNGYVRHFHAWQWKPKPTGWAAIAAMGSWPIYNERFLRDIAAAEVSP